MPPEEGTTPDNTGEQAKSSTSGQSVSTSDLVEGKNVHEWVTTYKGLQTAYNKLQDQTSKTIADLEAKLKDATVEIETLKAGSTSKESQAAVLQKEIVSLTQQIETLKNEKSQAETKVARSQLVMKEFPELASWEAQGLLPDGEAGDELMALFGKFRDNLSNNVSSEVKKTVAGSSPAGSGRTGAGSGGAGGAGGEKSADYWYAQMLQHAGRDDAKFAEAEAKYDELTKGS